MPNPSDLFLSPDLTEEQARAYLQSLGFRDAARADEYLQRMAADYVVREALGRLAPELLSGLLDSPNPDAAVAAIAHYLEARSGRAMFLDYLRDDPRALHVLTYVMGASPPLGEILIRTPEYFHWLVAQVERSAPDRQDHEEELVSAFAAVDDPAEGLGILRRWKRRELLRIGTRDLLRHETVPTAMAQLSDVAAVVVDFALAIVMQQRLVTEGRPSPPGAFAVMGTGALGSREMSYEADVDLLYVYDTGEGSGAAAAQHEFFARVGSDLTAALQDATADGQLYRVGLPRWPHVDGRPRACSLADYADHYARSTDIGERLALTRARPIAGDAALGGRFLACCQPFLYPEAAGSSEVPGVSSGGADESGLSTLERLTRVVQLRHGAGRPSLREAGTLGVLSSMSQIGLAPESACSELHHAYVFLRSASHRRQLGLAEESAEMQTRIDASRERVREICEKMSRK